MPLWSASVSVREEWAGCVSDLLARRVNMRTAPTKRAICAEYSAFFFHLVFIFVYCGLILSFKIVNVGWVVLLRAHTRFVKWQMERQLRDMSFVPIRTSLLRTLSSSSSSSSTASAPTGPFFHRLPPEIRRRILWFAFGGKTVHMDISLRSSPWQTPTTMGEWRANYPQTNDNVSWHHAAILTKNYDGRRPAIRRRYLVPGQRKWRWFSCICHRYPARGPEHLPLGRRRNYPWSRFYEPNEDLCLKGGGCCSEWTGGEWPNACFIGVTGFLYSCRQAYIEGMEVLYRTNTIHIGSAILIRRFQGILSPRIVSSVTSLELVWNTRILSMDDGFTGMPGKSKIKYPTPLFPSLQYLRVSFTALPWPQTADLEDINHAIGLPFSELNREKIGRQLHEYTLPGMDKLLDRIAPANADVTFSCPKWDWYSQIDLKLVEAQGVERTRPCRSEMEGLKCWRVVPRQDTPGTVDTVTPGDLEQGSGAPKLRDGYWIHVPIYQVSMYADAHVMSSYDQRRHDMYDLGAGRYGFK